MSGPKFHASGVVAADFDRVTSLLTTATAGPTTPTNGWIVHRTRLGAAELRGGPDRFDVLNGNSETLILDIDRERNIAALQGHWWYRGEYEATPERPGTRLTYRVYNVAPGAGWPVAVAHRFFIGYQRKVDQQVSALCADIEQHLHANH